MSKVGQRFYLESSRSGNPVLDQSSFKGGNTREDNLASINSLVIESPFHPKSCVLRDQIMPSESTRAASNIVLSLLDRNLTTDRGKVHGERGFGSSNPKDSILRIRAHIGSSLSYVNKLTGDLDQMLTESRQPIFGFKWLVEGQENNRKTNLIQKQDLSISVNKVQERISGANEFAIKKTNDNSNPKKRGGVEMMRDFDDIPVKGLNFTSYSNIVISLMNERKSQLIKEKKIRQKSCGNNQPSIH